MDAKAFLLSPWRKEWCLANCLKMVGQKKDFLLGNPARFAILPLAI
jgi:hypothetical protein